MYRKTLVVWIVLWLLVTTAGCSAASPQFSGKALDTAPRNAVQEAAPAAAPRAATDGRAGGATSPNQPAPSDADRMVVRNAELSLVVSETEAALQAVTALVKAAGGYISDANSWRQGEQLRSQVVVRIPAEKLDESLLALKKLAVRVEREKVSGQDVTEEYSDLNAQLVNLEATEKELRELLSEVRQRTQKAEDILQVYRELTSIRGEIERVKGRMQYLSNLTALATINIELIPDSLAKPVVEPGWRPLETLKNAGRELVNALKGLADVLIYFVILVLPIVLIVVGVLYLFIRLLRALFGRRAKPGSPAVKPNAVPDDKPKT